MEEGRHSDLKIIRWTDRILATLSGEHQPPIKANLDLTNLCSHNCSWCEPLDYRKHTIEDKRHTLSTEKAMEVIDDLAEMGCRMVLFSGGGEPTLHRDFGSILEYADRCGMRTMLITHGGLLKSWSNSLLHHGWHIRVSLDASNSEEHRGVHNPAHAFEFEKVIDGIRELIGKRAGGKWPEVGIAYVVTPGKNDSPSSLNRVVDLACGLGVDYLHFRPASGITQASAWLAASGIIEEIEQTHPKVKIWCFGKRLNEIFTQREFEKCYAALTLATIGSNGDVSACCDRRDIVFGNVNEKRFRDIWLSEAHRVKASTIVPKICSRCLQCSYNRSVERNVIHNDALPELL